MSTPFQNRLVGTIIVSAAVIIFLPDILDGEKQSYQADFEAIPNAPAFVKKQADKTFPIEKINTVKQPIVEETALDDDVETKVISNRDNDELKIAVLTKDKPLENTPPEVSKAKTTTVAKEKVIKKAPEKAVVNRAWVIHLGSFRHKQNVKELLAKLKENGYVAFTRPIKTKKGTLTKVYVGPELIKSSLDKKLPKLKALTGVQGKVARFDANK